MLEEAFEFVQNQNQKTRNKILQNIRRAEQHSDPKFFKKNQKRFGSLEPYTLESNIDFWLFGIRKVKMKLLFSQRME